MPDGLPDFAPDDNEAKRRFEATRGADPFPEIPPALLNTADLLDYIAATGMIHPFSPDPARKEDLLKPASCAIPVAGKWVYWPPTSEQDDPEGRSGCLQRDGELWLRPNSIVYVTLEPYFRIPDYIAARYNLRIKHIYQGILVGTGPLVDPGFTGYLSVPLHNLTANPYRIRGGAPLVWMEFTKLSPNARWATQPATVPPRRGEYVEFPKRKLERQTVRHYVAHAHDGPIRSSIPEQTERASAAAADAEATVSRVGRLALFGAVGAAAAIVALFFAAVTFVDGTRDDLQRLEMRLEAQQDALQVCARRGASSVSTRCLQRELARR